MSNKIIKNANKQTTEKSELVRLIEVSIVLYILVMALVFPFYLTKGYTHVGTDKNLFFRYAALTFSIVVLVLGLIYAIIYHSKIQWKSGFKQMSVTDKFALMYGLTVMVSYLLSDYKDNAFWGRDGWYIGLMTQLMYLVIYFFISRFFAGNEWLQYPYILSSILVFAMGILNRFSIYPFQLKGQSTGFISTLGNINWFCSYWSVLFPIAAVLFLYKADGKEWKTLLYGLLYSVMLVAGGIQGSDSGGIVLAAVFLVLFCGSVHSVHELKNYFGMVTLSMALFQGVRLIRFLFPQAMNMQTSITELLTQGNLTLIGFIVAGVLYVVCLLFERKYKRQRGFLLFWKWFRNVVFVLLGLGVVTYIALLIINTKGSTYIEGISDKGIFYFDEYFGNNRGATWMTGIALFGEMPFLQKLIGIGPDCFAEYAYREGSGVIEMLRQVFGNATLTNAHNEWLTTLVNMGLLGLISYSGMFLSAMIRYLKNLSKNPWIYACGLAALCYTAHNMVSFQQALNGPIMFLVLAIGENLMRKENK